MVIITEEPDSTTSKTPTSPKPHKPSSASPSPLSTTAPNPFKFWFYFTLLVSLLTLFFISLSSPSPQDSKVWFLSLPTNLRHHYSKGRIIKVQNTPNHSSIEVFTIQEGPITSDNILIVHGLGCNSYSFSKIAKSLGLKGIRSVAIDLPGSGFSDKSSVVVEEIGGGVLGRFWEIYYDIKEKGLFWGLDQLVEQGYIDFEEGEAVRFRRGRLLKKLNWVLKKWESFGASD